MRKHHENHRKSSHRIDVCYTLLCHFICKSKEKSWNSWLFREKNVTLQHKCENQSIWTFSMDNISSKRIEYIDALRGMTMILVVYSHIARWGFDNVHMAYNDIFIRFRMPIFFFISGWLFFKIERIWNKSTIYSILKKKFMVQIIPFLFFMSLYMFLFNAPEYHSSFEGKYGYWFTFSLFQYFVIYIAIESLLNKQRTNKNELIVMIIMFVLSFTAYYYEHIKFFADLGIWRPILSILSFSKIKYIIFFWLGTFVKKNFSSFIHITDNQYLIALCIGIFISLHIWPYSTNLGFDFISFLLSGATGIIIIFTFFRKNKTHFSKNKKIGAVLQYIGQRTLDIYLLHYFILPYHMNSMGIWLSQHSSKSIDMIIILFISLWIIAISLLISNIIRLSPFLGHYLFGVKNRL